MNDRALRAAVGILTAAGAAIAGYLTYARFTHTALACTTGGCEIVQRSDYAELAGIPVALLGLAAYVFLFGTAFSSSELARVAGAGVAVAGAAFSAYLVYVQIAVIDAICQWCVASDVVMALLASICVARVIAGGPGPQARAH
jgi:uncharacterized membrane protein